MVYVNGTVLLTPDEWAAHYPFLPWARTGSHELMTEADWRSRYQVIIPTPADETRKRLWVDVFYRGVQEIHCSANPDKSASEAAHRADLAVAEYDQRFWAP